MVYHRNGSPSPAAKAPRIIEKDDERVSERVPSFSIEVGDILLRVEKQGDHRLASQLVSLPSDTCFVMNIFKPNIKSLADFEAFRTKQTR